MTAANRKIRITYAGMDLTLQEWAEETGLSYAVIYRRYVAMGWSPEETLTTPVGKRGGRGWHRGPVEEAISLAAGDGWVIALRLAIVLLAVRDYRDPYYRRDVEVFFRNGFERLFGLDGQAMLDRLAETA